MRFPVVRLVLFTGAVAWPAVGQAQQKAATSRPTSASSAHQIALALVVSSAYLHDQLAKGASLGRVEFDARSLTRLVPDSASALTPRVTQALGVALADETRLETCKPVHTTACELGPAQQVLEVSSASVKGTHATVEIRRYQAAGASTTTLTSTVLRMDLVLVSTGWVVTKYGTAASQ